MPVSGLVVSLSNDDVCRTLAIEAIGKQPWIEVGVIEANRMAVVLDTPSADEDKKLWAWLNGLAGVVFVDLVMVGFEGDPQRHDCVDREPTWQTTPSTSRGM